MTENRSRVYMTMVLVFGGAGLFVAGSLSSCMMPMMGMMGMDEKNDQGHMKEMMQQMMGGMLPPGITPQDLPDPESRGAKLLSRYCSQYHNLPSPRMHTAEDWPRIAGRMLSRERMMTLCKRWCQGQFLHRIHQGPPSFSKSVHNAMPCLIRNNT